MIQWNVNFSPLLDESIQRVQQISWNGPVCFTPLADSQRWLATIHVLERRTIYRGLFCTAILDTDGGGEKYA